MTVACRRGESRIRPESCYSSRPGAITRIALRIALCRRGESCIRPVRGRSQGSPLPKRVYTCQHGKNKNRAEQFYGDLVGLGMALHHRVSAPDFLEGCARDCIVAVLSWDVVQLAGALIRIGHFMKMRNPEQIGTGSPASTSNCLTTRRADPLTA